MLDAIKDTIIRFLKHDDYTPLKLGKLARELGITPENFPQFKQAFDDLCAAGHVVIGHRNLVDLRPLPQQITGVFRANPKGFGFVIPSEPNAHGDLYIGPYDTKDAMNGDRVVATTQRRRGRFAGKVIDILERSHNQLVGTLFQQNKDWLVQPEGGVIFEPIAIEDVGAKQAREHDKVVIEMITYPSTGHLGRAVILKVLGRAGLYDTEIKAIMAQYHLPDEFDDACTHQAQSATGAFDPERCPGREDLTEQWIITIDPPDAKDFDDAISLGRLDNGHWRLGVHIADVSHFIEAGSPLDDEAYARGNSVYLPGKTIPMLPERLSNGICSLQPKQHRFTKTAFIDYDDQGQVLNRRLANCLICSKQRLTYLQANDILLGKTGDHDQRTINLLRDMDTLSRLIERRRNKNSMIHLDLHETEIAFDPSGQMVDAHPAEDSYPHTIIEMFMVEANEAAASLLDRLTIPCMRRVHPDPDVVSLKNVAALARTFGFGMPKVPDRYAIQDLLKRVKGTPYVVGINLAVLRSLAKAEYGPQHIGHYALASRCYCHFTSPIRRYADLLIHRAIQDTLTGSVDQAKHKAHAMDLVDIGKHISFTEQNADRAEQELKKVLILQFLSQHIGETLDGVVTGLTSFGVFVQSLQYGIEGLIKIDDLGPDQWHYHARTHAVLGQHSGTIIRLGQPLRAKILKVNVPGRHLDLLPDEPLSKPVRSAGRTKKSRARQHTRRSGRKQKKRR
jgi:ribonuclease R